MRTLLEQGKQSFEYRFADAAGAYRWIRNEASLTRDAHGGPGEIVGYWMDITERKESEEELRRYEHIVAATSDIITFVDRNYTYQAVNQRYLDIFGKTLEMVVDRTLPDVIGNEIFETHLKPDLERCFAGERISYDRWSEFKGLGRRCFNVVFDPYRDANSSVAGAVISSRDITERKLAEEELTQYRRHLEQLVAERTRELSEANQKLKQLAYFDALTGIANRRQFDDVMNLEIRRTARDEKPLSLILCDVDYFKRYHDTYGHAAGDNCLKQIAELIAASFKRAADFPARYGGEEFAVILPQTDAGESHILAERLRERIWDANIAHIASQIADRVTLSLGVTTVQPEQLNPAKLIARSTILKTADEALYRAKATGRNRVEGAVTTNPS
jgi:diguanylate cyclase (GGDEF)-like protein/PAS domain S-box-containing protein